MSRIARGERGGEALRDRLQARLAAAGANAGEADAAFTEAMLRLRARRLAAPRDQVTTRPDGTSVLSFLIGAERYALAMDDLSEVMPMAACTPVPGQPQYLLGVVNIRGEIRPVLDLHAMLGLPAPDPRCGAYAVFLANGGAIVGVRVDALERIGFVETATLTVPHLAANGLPQRFIAGITPETLILLDSRQILALDALRDRRA